MNQRKKLSEALVFLFLLAIVIACWMVFERYKGNTGELEFIYQDF